MRLSLTEHAEAKAIVADLEGTEATHGKAGVIVVDASGLRLDANRVDGFDEGLPDELLSVVERLKKAAENEDERAKRALVLLYDLVRDRG